MNGETTYGQEPGISIAGPNHIRETQEAALTLEAMAMESKARHRIDRQSSTWLAIKEFMKKQADGDYMPMLRNRTVEYPETQYARGALDAFDSLLEFAGEEV